MGLPGITVEPIRTLAGDHELNQVFFDDVRVPQANRLGAENQGWSVAKHLLTFERGGKYAPGLIGRLERLRAQGGVDPVLRAELDRAAVALKAGAAERRVGTECVSRGRSRCSPQDSKKKKST